MDCAKAQTRINDIITFDDEKKLFWVGKQTYILEDEEGKLTIGDILKPEHQQKFQRNEKDVFIHRPTNSKFWLKLSIQNRTNKEAWIELGSSYLWYVDYFTNQNGKYALAIQTGSFYHQESDYPSYSFWLPIEPIPEVQTVYVSVQTETSIEIPIKVGGILPLSKEKTQNDYLIGGFVGLMVVMFAYNLFLFFATRDRIYLPYLGYVMSSIFASSYLNKYPLLTFFVGESSQTFIYLYSYIWLGLPFVFACYFSIYFLNLKVKFPIFRRLLQFNIFLFGLLFPFINLFSILPYYLQAIIYQMATLFVAVSLLYVCLHLYVAQKEKAALFYMIGWFWAIGGVVIYVLTMNEILPYHFFARHSILIGQGIEVLLFSLALADRINQLKSEKNMVESENLRLIQVQNKLLEQKVAERTAEIHQNQELLEQTGKIARIGAWELALPSLKVTWSKVTREIHEVSADYEPDLAKSEAFYKVGEGLDSFTIATRQCIKDGTPFDLELELITAKGREIWVRVLGNAVYENEQIVRLFGTFQDIDERKKIQETLKEERTLLRTIIDNLPINVYVKDLSLKKILANKAEYEYVGAKTENEIIGKTDEELYPIASSQISRAEDEFVIGTGQPILNQETLNIKFDDHQHWFLISKIPFKNPAGQIIGLVGISYDFTERKKAEAILRKTLDELQTAQNVLQQQTEEIAILNNQLEVLVEERTRQLIKRNTQLNEYAFFNAHKLRAPIATILGLYQVLELDISTEEREMVIQKLRESVVLLDEMVRKSQKLLDEVGDE
jgi:PAS domain S-box-containing protein